MVEGSSLERMRDWRLAALVLALGVATAAADSNDMAHAGEVRTPQPNLWLTYEAFGNISGFEPSGNGAGVASVGDLRWPVFALRLHGRPDHGRLSADLRTPADFDGHYLLAADVQREESQERRLEQALAHHRPAARLHLDANGRARLSGPAAFDRYQACARRSLRAEIEAQTRDPANRRRIALLRGRAEDLPRRMTLPVEPASLLLRLSTSPIPADPARDVRDGLGAEIEANIRRETQTYWLGQQIRTHGRAVRLELDLITARDSPAARLCRSVGPSRLSRRHADRCSIEGIIDRRDGWPLTIGLSRQAEASDGTREGQVRIFHRLAPLEGFVTPTNPCT